MCYCYILLSSKSHIFYFGSTNESSKGYSLGEGFRQG
jgi:hypothetical protein